MLFVPHDVDRETTARLNEQAGALGLELIQSDQPYGENCILLASLVDSPEDSILEPLAVEMLKRKMFTIELAQYCLGEFRSIRPVREAVTLAKQLLISWMASEEHPTRMSAELQAIVKESKLCQALYG